MFLYFIYELGGDLVGVKYLMFAPQNFRYLNQFWCRKLFKQKDLGNWLKGNWSDIDLYKPLIGKYPKDRSLKTDDLPLIQFKKYCNKAERTVKEKNEPTQVILKAMLQHLKQETDLLRFFQQLQYIKDFSIHGG